MRKTDSGSASTGDRPERTPCAGSIVAVVDVLSFTTAVTVAADLGIDVYPYRWRDESAVAYAKQYDAVLAVGRSEAGPGDVSLSPVTIRQAQGIERLVLPSPNGSTICQQLSDSGCHRHRRLAAQQSCGRRSGSASGWPKTRSSRWWRSRQGSAGRTARSGPRSRTSGVPAGS